MSETIKFTADELKQITELRDASQAKVVEFGQLKLERFLADQRYKQIDELESKSEEEYKALQKQEVELVNTFKEKYGVGTVDLESGEFIPAN